MKKNPTPAAGASPPASSSSANATKKTSETSAAKSKALTQFRLGKDEMNLVEHPFALLKRGATDSVIYLEYDKTHPRTGKLVRAHWRVEGSAELGLPGPVEERLYLVLLELSREQGFPHEVMFSRSDILRRLGISDGPKNYTMLHDAFLRLKSVTIDAKRSFWLAASNDFAASVMFSILDEVKMSEEAAGRRKGQIPLALSSFRWSELMFSSLQAGNIRSLNIEFALSLELPLSARLFRYLDKHRTAGATFNKSRYEIELHRLCEIHLGMTKARYASKLKERLAPAFEELRARGFLADVRYEAMKSAPSEEKVVFYFTNDSLDAGDKNEAGAPLVVGRDSNTSVIPSGFSAVDLIVAWDAEEGEARDAACDAVFAALSDDERAAIDAWAFEQMPPFLRSNRSLEGARSTLTRYRRSRVMDDFGDRVRVVLAEAARAEVEAPRN